MLRQPSRPECAVRKLNSLKGFPVGISCSGWICAGNLITQEPSAVEKQVWCVQLLILEIYTHTHTLIYIHNSMLLNDISVFSEACMSCLFSILCPICVVQDW